MNTPTLADAQAAVDAASKTAKQDPNRPIYHAICPANWMNDPNGPIAINGEIHVFYQHNPFKADWGPMYWGHMKSKDMVYWTHLPIAFGPSWDSENGCWSGCCVQGADDLPRALYTSVGPDRPALTDSEQWLAIGSQDMAKWKKFKGNPVMTHKLHSGLRIEDWRDPCAWREGGSYYCAVGGHLVQDDTPKNNPSVFLYKSPDLVRWQFVGVLYTRFHDKIDADADENVKLGTNWECPLFFPLGDKHVLEVSVNGTAYSIGEFKNNRFTAGRWHALDNSATFYAPNTFADFQGRRIIIGWVLARGNGTWNGCFSLPRVVAARPNGTLSIEPIPELAKLRDKHLHRDALSIPPNTSIPMFDEKSFSSFTKTRALECAFQVDMTQKVGEKPVPPAFDVQVYAFKKVTSVMGCVGYEPEDSLLFLGNKSGPFTIETGEESLNARLFIDRQVVEIYVNNRWALTHVIEITPDQAIKLVVSSQEAPVELRNMDCWNLKSINM
nr:glycoside hydrolase family 32 protein [Candidatus Sigynarchaeota archaeon]